MKRVLFVDDEPNVLQGLRRMLRPMRHEWDMHFAEGPEQAIEALKAQPFEVVVTDMRMPHMDGARLLEHVKENDPGVARIVLSGQTDKEAALRSSATAHQFLAKPCEAEALKNAVQRACQLRALLSDDKVVSLASGIGKLPSLPEVYAELTAELNSEDLSINRVAEIVGKDVAMTAKILQLVNSAFFGLPRKVESIEQAVTYLGTDTIRGLVLSNAAFEAFEGESRDFDLRALWQHSLWVGSVAHSLAKSAGAAKYIVDESLPAGMLHDIGKLILRIGFPDKYGEARALADAESVPQHEAERRTLGCDHGQIGAYLIGLWGLPDGIVEALAYHHDPSRCPMTEFTPLAAVHIADALVHRVLDGDESTDATLCETVLDAVGARDKLEDWMDRTRELLDCRDAA